RRRVRARRLDERPGRARRARDVERGRRHRAADDGREPERLEAGGHPGSDLGERCRPLRLPHDDRSRLIAGRAAARSRRMETLLQQIINGLSLGAIYALIALGYTMVYGVLRLINFAHGDVYMLGAFSGYYLAHALGLDGNPSVLGAIVVTIGAMAFCAIVGMLIERFAYKPVRHHPRLTALITAIGVSLLLEYGGQVVFGATPRLFPQMSESRTYALGGVQITNQHLLIILVAVVVMFGLEFIVHRTRIGKAMRATSYNLQVAKLMGINTDRVIAF